MNSPFIDDAIADDREIKDAQVTCRCEAEIYWYILPGTEWTEDDALRQRDSAAAWFRKYCIELSFRPIDLSAPADAARKQALDRATADYTDAMRPIPHGGIALETNLDTLQAAALRIHEIIEDKAKQNRPADEPKTPLVVLFLDDWYVLTGELGGERQYRVSANESRRLLVGMTRYDRESKNMLTHELTHALRRATRKQGRNGKCGKKFVRVNRIRNVALRPWQDHYAGRNQDKAMTRPSRTNPYTPESFPDSRVLSLREYMSILEAGYVDCGRPCAGGGKRAEIPETSREFRSLAPEHLDSAMFEPFSFGGLRMPGRVVLGWRGKSVLDAVHLLRLRWEEGGIQAVPLNREPLPPNGCFFDTGNPPWDFPDFDVFEGLTSIEAPAHPLTFSAWIHFLAGLRNPPLDFCCHKPGVVWLKPGEYRLAGVFATGERDGEADPAPRECTEEERQRVIRRIQAALDAIRERGLIEKLKPNPDNITFDQLLAQVQWEVDCGQIGVAGKTWPVGLAQPGTNKAKSHITFNGAYCSLITDEMLIALVLHELMHALQNLTGVNLAAAQGTPADTALDAVRREIEAFTAVWERIAAGDVILIERIQCAEMTEALRQIMHTFEDSARLLAEGGGALSDAQRDAIAALRASGRRLLLLYKTALQDDDAPCKYRHRDGTEEELSKLLDRLLDATFREP